jgi:hypothetical protein
MADTPIESMRIRTPPSTEDDVIIIEVNRSVHPNDMKSLHEFKDKIKHSDKMIDMCVNRMIFVAGFLIVFAYYGFII